MRVVTVTSGKRWLDSLKAATEDIGGKRWFWFALDIDLTSESILEHPVWFVAGEATPNALIETD